MIVKTVIMRERKRERARKESYVHIKLIYKERGRSSERKEKKREYDS